MTIQSDESIIALLSAAGRDETAFPDPDRLDITREKNRQITFGLGSHFCLGAPLARMEGTIAFRALAKGFPTMRLAVDRDTLEWSSALSLRGLRRRFQPMIGSLDRPVELCFDWKAGALTEQNRAVLRLTGRFIRREGFRLRQESFRPLSNPSDNVSEGMWGIGSVTRYPIKVSYQLSERTHRVLDLAKSLKAEVEPT